MQVYVLSMDDVLDEDKMVEIMACGTAHIIYRERSFPNHQSALIHRVTLLDITTSAFLRLPPPFGCL